VGNEGYLSALEAALKTHISEADSSLSPEATHVITHLDDYIYNFEPNNFPIVTVRIGKSSNIEAFFGRHLSKTKRGTYITVPFSLTVFHNHSTTNSKESLAMDIADAIKSKLLVSNAKSVGLIRYTNISIEKRVSNLGSVSQAYVEGIIEARRAFNA